MASCPGDTDFDYAETGQERLTKTSTTAMTTAMSGEGEVASKPEQEQTAMLDSPTAQILRQEVEV